MKLAQKARYFFKSLRNYDQPARQVCPNCDHAGPHRTVETKYWVTRLVECPGCRLRFRTPTDPPDFNEAYYQETYSEGFTTDCPDEMSLKKLKKNGFEGHEKNFNRFIEIIRLLNPRTGLSICDFGCSWGYGAWQFQEAGFRVVGHELSKPRAAYAREKMGIDLPPALDVYPETFDVFFSSHVLEHVPVIRDVWALAGRVLKPGGLFIAVTPNGSEELRQVDPGYYTKVWGQVHPNMVGCRFYENLFAKNDYFLETTPWNERRLTDWAKHGGQVVGAREGRELLAIARKAG